MYTSLCDRTDLIGLIFYHFVSAAEQRKGKLFFTDSPLYPDWSACGVCRLHELTRTKGTLQFS
jgi:hypothetical protein